MPTQASANVTSPGGLYVHVPFCHARCYYCDFYSSGNAPDYLKARYVERVIEEVATRAPQGLGTPFTTVYLGGGTPSSLPQPLLERLVTSLDTSACREFTVEVNPEDVTTSLCEMLSLIPECRVSMGVQSLIDSELLAVGRRHSAATAIRACRMLQSHGIINISLDLIYGLPGQTLSSFDTSLRGILGLAPRHVSAYLLSYEPRSRLSLMRDRGIVSEVSAEDACRYYHHLCDAMAAAGYEHYEISNFSLPGCHSHHNSSYWDGTPYLGVGPGAHSFDGITRRYNSHNLRRYIDGGFEATLAVDEDDNPRARLNDMLITRLRTREGISLGDVASRFGDDAAVDLLDDASSSLAAGHLIRSGDRLAIPEEHWLITDSVLLDLIQ